MFNYILKRIGFGLLALFILMTLVFFLSSSMPGYSLTQNPNEPQDSFFQRLDTYGLRDPLIIQYGRFWVKWITTGEFGIYFGQTKTVNEVFKNAIKFTLPIASIAFVISVLLGMTFGIVSAVHRGMFIDTFINVLSVFFLSVPSFVIGALLVYWASTNNWGTSFVQPDSSDYTFEKMAKSAILPIFTLVISLTPTIVYYTRNEMVDVLNQDYIKTALSKGMSYTSVIVKHGIRNALIPILSILVPLFLVVISGSLIIEIFYSVPGIAKQLTDAINGKQVYLLMYNAMVVSGIYFLLQIIIDSLYVVIDPRIRLAQSNNMSLTRKIVLKIKRELNSRKWIKLANENNYIEIKEKSEIYNELVVNEGTKSLLKNKLYLYEDVINKYNIDVEKKYAVIDNQIYKIQYKNIKVGKEN